MFPFIDFQAIYYEGRIEVELSRCRASILEAFVRAPSVQTIQKFVFEGGFTIGDVGAGRAKVLNDMEGIGPIKRHPYFLFDTPENR